MFATLGARTCGIPYFLSSMERSRADVVLVEEEEGAKDWMEEGKRIKRGRWRRGEDQAQV